ncbi:MAG TPA: FAD-dependent oxidoreductase, partial [Flavobacterium sp.]|nr:FAD-dependent oxidoreductase [Flavobacterium sp.]
MNNSDVVIIGAGLAGLTAAIHLSKIGIKVTIVEKHTFPRHKVCGEYISNEVLPYLEWLDIDLAAINPVQISKISFSGVDGKLINGKLPLGGFGISRYAFDLLLYNKAIANGCKFLENAVTEVAFDDNKFAVSLGDGSFLIADIVIGAFGKRSNIDQKMQRSFIKKKSPWLAVKAHYSGTFEDDTVGLHNFDGGYCGVSKVENDQINICYLADYDSFKRYKNIDDYQKAIVLGNPNLQKI